MINESGWGGVQIASNPKKTTASFKVDDQGNMINFQEFADETGAEKLARIQSDRAKKLGLQ